MKKLYDQNGELHCEDGPAIEYTDGSYWWYRQGALHRDDGSAVEVQGINGGRLWYQHRKLHREDGPAIDFNDQSKKPKRYID